MKSFIHFLLLVCLISNPAFSSAEDDLINPGAGATFYEDHYYLGYAVYLEDGAYSTNDIQILGIRNDDITSAKVSPGYEVVLYEHDNYQGSRVTFKDNVKNFVYKRFNNGRWLNDQVSSIVVRKVDNIAASVYKHHYYEGNSGFLNVGAYNINELKKANISNDDISSLKVLPGYEVVLYEHDNYQGSWVTFKDNIDNFVYEKFSNGQPLNDKVSSMIIRFTGTTFKYENNPLVKHVRTADPAAKVWADGKLWIYTSHDMENATDYHSMDGYHVFSSEDMVHWIDYGEIFHSSDVPWSQTDGRMYAPDVAYKNGTYYLYFPHEPEKDNEYVIGVATSTKPDGPFTDVGHYIKGTDGINDGIDPCILIDDNGDAYLYWGGPGPDYPPRVARLKQNMIELAETPKSIELAQTPKSIHNGNNNLFEGVFVFKRHGKYYYTYTDDGGGGLLRGAYAMGTNPYGPFIYKGVISVPTEDKFGAQIHHSMIEYKGQWYYFYHHGNYNGGDGHKRNVAIDKLEFSEDGTIKTVILTLEGVAPQQ
jgi:arabinoxylan arabinofuranohydrolase